ncbi:HsdR family type I site-specific deoxyribonuclease [Mesomycoplasma conjunctivae]|uniref:HsdR family type I site-specific deoxyribonuclease n=1 Tax=Mesomycoplasma conjunctivae TaxID=45361 RepID=UPI003DA6293E
MPFTKEANFEQAIIQRLIARGWSDKVLRYQTEKDLIDNFAKILFENNKGIDRLNGYPLTEGEKQQIIEQIKSFNNNPLKLNEFINGKTIAIKRDHPEDTAHKGKEISLFIYDREEIAGGKSVYQIAQQTKYEVNDEGFTSSRGDILLLINGLPVIHIELKRSGVIVERAIEQIKWYHKKGVFSNFFSLVQVFVAMNPEDSKYFANPGHADKFNDKFYFRWANRENEPYQSWEDIVDRLLSIPMAHKLIGFYTIPDHGDQTLKVLRSYQYYAIEAIFNRVKKAHWTKDDRLGGFIWHTTGSGKTMTSFKAAQLLSNLKDCDKVVFLTDRTELGLQTVTEYRNLASGRDEVQETKHTYELIKKLKSNKSSDNLIVTSIQKMNKIGKDNYANVDLDSIAKKHIVIIIDEAHRSVFGEMLIHIRKTFPTALYFGFTGTPILEHNKKNENEQSDLFGNELHRYSIRDGIRDKNVLPFDLRRKPTIKDDELKEKFALWKTNPRKSGVADLDEKERSKYDKIEDKIELAEAEEELGSHFFDFNESKPKEDQHAYKVVLDILKEWDKISYNKEYHAIFATESIKEAIIYYRLFKEIMQQESNKTVIKIACLFDKSFDNRGDNYDKEAALVEIISDYNERYKKTFRIDTFADYKKDIAHRLSHKGIYTNIKDDDKIDLLIVVDQMLTGFDSKWINTLYLDKILKNENIIQAFSRTNRIWTQRKQYGIIKYYRSTNWMRKLIREAFEHYAGKDEKIIFVPKLEENIKKINQTFGEISEIFKKENIKDFEYAPSSKYAKKDFVKLYNKLYHSISGARPQGLCFKDEPKCDFNYPDITWEELLILKQRNEDITNTIGTPTLSRTLSTSDLDLDYQIHSYESEKINNQFFDDIKISTSKKSEFKSGNPKNIDEFEEWAKYNLKKYSKVDQNYIKLILKDAKEGKIQIDDSQSPNDLINQYKEENKVENIKKFAEKHQLDFNLLNKVIQDNPDDLSIQSNTYYKQLLKEIKGQNLGYLQKLKIGNLLHNFITKKEFENN